MQFVVFSVACDFIHWPSVDTRCFIVKNAFAVKANIVTSFIPLNLGIIFLFRSRNWPERVGLNKSSCWYNRDLNQGRKLRCHDDGRLPLSFVRL